MIMLLAALIFQTRSQGLGTDPRCPVEFAPSRPFVPIIVHSIQDNGINVAQELYIPVVGNCSYDEPSEPVFSGGEVPAAIVAITRDSQGFLDQEGNNIDADSLDFFMEAIGAGELGVDPTTLFDKVHCQVEFENGDMATFGDESVVLTQDIKNPAQISQYSCDITYLYC